MEVPKHAFELTIHLGAVDKKSVGDLLRDIALKYDLDDEVYSVTSGWSVGAYDIQVEKRDVPPDQYREELDEWNRWKISQRNKDGEE